MTSGLNLNLLDIGLDWFFIQGDKQTCFQNQLIDGGYLERKDESRNSTDDKEALELYFKLQKITNTSFQMASAEEDFLGERNQCTYTEIFGCIARSFLANTLEKTIMRKSYLKSRKEKYESIQSKFTQ